MGNAGRRKKCMLSLIGKPEGEGPLVRPRSRWKDDVRVDVKKTVCEIVDSVHMAQSLADVGTLMVLWVP
jgi:hypothetical protein